MAPYRRGDWMQTATGKQFWPLDPRPEEVDILDIAAHLSKICRYNGACDWHYSVAQHSVYVSHQVPPEHALAALLHDATEAYTCDIHRPVKRHLVGYAEIEAGVWLAVAERFGLDEELPECVHVADNEVLLAEKAQIMRPAPAPWNVPGEPAPIRIAYWTPDQAREAFLSRFEVLMRAKVPAGVPEARAPNTMGADQVWSARRLSDPKPAAGVNPACGIHGLLPCAGAGCVCAAGVAGTLKENGNG